jgi:hypothetical protein
MSDKNNVFFYSPGGYGPHEQPQFWAERVEYEGDEEDWLAAASDLHDEIRHDIDYGCFFMSREQAEDLVKQLQKLLEE